MASADAKKHTAAFGWFGLLAVAAFVVMWLACIGADTSWVWGSDPISDFGVSDTDAATFFKYGMVLTGALAAVFGVGETFNKSQFGYILSGIMLILCGICMAFVGVFTSSTGDLHLMFAYMAGIFAAAAQYWSCGKYVPAGITIVLFCIAAASAFAYDFAHFEVIAITMILVWLAMNAAMTIASSLGNKQEISA